MMDRNLIEILKKSKAVMDKAENLKPSNNGSQTTISEMDKFDSVLPDTKLLSEHEVMSMGQQPVTQKSTNSTTISPNSSEYRQRIKESKLPPEVANAMLNNPIQQSNFSHSFDLSEELINEINPNKRQNIPQSVPQNITENVATSDLRKIIAEEIAKALPKVVEDYFDKRVIREDIQIKVGNTIMSGNMKPLPKVDKKVKKQ